MQGDIGKGLVHPACAYIKGGTPVCLGPAFRPVNFLVLCIITSSRVLEKNGRLQER